MDLVRLRHGNAAFPQAVPTDMTHEEWTFAALHFVAFACLMLHRLLTVVESP